MLSVFIFVAYEREAAGFQFYEKIPLVPPLGISYELAVDGMSLLMVLLTSIIIFAGVFASWTVATRSQEFYALLLALVTGVYGVFVSLDLFVFFLFYELAVLPMYLLIGIWGSSGEVRPARDLRLGVPRDRRGLQRVRGDEAHALPAVRLGVHPGRDLRPLRTATGSGSFSFLELEAASVHPAHCSSGCSWPSTSASGSWPASGPCTPGRPTATPPRPPRSRCCTPACS